MTRIFIAMLVAAFGASAASTLTLAEIASSAGALGGSQGLDLDALYAAAEKVGGAGAGTVLLPIVFLLLRGLQSYVVSVAVLAAAMVGGMIYLGVDLPLEQMAITAAAGSAVGVGAYRLMT